jgi:hypothetical protein
MGRVAGSVTADVEAAARYGGHGTGVTRLAWSQELREVLNWLTNELIELGYPCRGEIRMRSAFRTLFPSDR